MSVLDAHAKPPDALRQRYKRYQTISLHALAQDEQIFDAARGRFAGCLASSFALPQELGDIFHRFLGRPCDADAQHPPPPPPLVAYQHPHVPGLIIIPSLLPSTVQSSLLDKLLHRHLSNPAHQTNLHAHYNVAYPPPSSAARPFPSYFSPEASTLVQAPKDPSIHKPLSMPTCLNKKLRWVTLGGQYDWTRKVYPSGPPPPFPQDIAALVEGLFPTMKAQAAIVNLYTPGDTLSLHRDVSEECDRPLASISVGCDGLFIAGLDNGDGEGSRSITMRLRSGDVVLMTGPSRYAWHGVPQILANTCPDWLKDWPAGEATEDGEGEGFDHWRGWMTKKRINLNVRQMRD